MTMTKVKANTVEATVDELLANGLVLADDGRTFRELQEDVELDIDEEGRIVIRAKMALLRAQAVLALAKGPDEVATSEATVTQAQVDLLAATQSRYITFLATSIKMDTSEARVWNNGKAVAFLQTNPPVGVTKREGKATISGLVVWIADRRGIPVTTGMVKSMEVNYAWHRDFYLAHPTGAPAATTENAFPFASWKAEERERRSDSPAAQKRAAAAQKKRDEAKSEKEKEQVETAVLALRTQSTVMMALARVESIFTQQSVPLSDGSSPVLSSLELEELANKLQMLSNLASDEAAAKKRREAIK